MHNEKNLKLLFDIASKARTDAVGYFHDKSKKRYERQQVQGINHDLISDHLSGKQPFGIYMCQGTESSIGVIDLDDHDGTSDPAQMRDIARAIYDALLTFGMRPLVVRSGGGKGIHIWVVFRNPQSARNLRQFLRKQIGRLGLKDGAGGIAKKEVEIFPKQDKVAEGGYGNLIALPFARASLPLNPATMEPIPLANYYPLELEHMLADDLEEQENESKLEKDKHYSLPLPDDREEVAAALKYVPSDDYSEWIVFGLALKNTFGDGGFSIWEEWSRKSAKFNPLDCKDRWDGLKPNGRVGLGTIFYRAQEFGWNGPSNSVIREMNAKYGILTQGNKTSVIQKVKDPDDEDESIYLGVRPFFDRHIADLVPTNEQDKKVSKARFWFKHPLATRYNSTMFDPSKPPGHNGKIWNLWRGFPYEPIPGSWEKLKAHILDNVCKGDRAKYEWLLNWLALGLQKPGDVIGTAIVLVGTPGIGKGVLAQHYGELWKPHFLSMTHQSQVYGQFNGHLASRRVIFIDEGMFGGNRKDAGVMKTRITETFLMLERKGHDAVRMRNRAMYIISSNEASVVPADLGDRRWMFFDVSEKHKEDKPYFAAIEDELKNGGYEAMMYELLHRDTALGPDPSKIIRTKELFHQILDAQPAYVRFAFHLLDAACLPQANSGALRVTTIRALLDEYRRLHRDDIRMDEATLGRRLQKLVGGITTKMNGQYKIHTPNGPIYKRSTQYNFPPLAQARSAFERSVGIPIEWGNEARKWVPDDEGKVDDAIPI